MSELFLETYSGQSVQQLVAMKSTHRIDSLVLAVEQALGSKPEALLSEQERVVLAVEAMEREVNNGGYQQFFVNSSRECTGFLVQALELIDCPACAAISTDAIAILKLPEEFDADKVESIASELSEASNGQLDTCDSRYFGNRENIEERLFDYIEKHQHEIQIPYKTKQ
jgi:Domain of unknown function (DUF4375)